MAPVCTQTAVVGAGMACMEYGQQDGALWLSEASQHAYSAQTGWRESATADGISHSRAVQEIGRGLMHGHGTFDRAFALERSMEHSVSSTAVVSECAVHH